MATRLIGTDDANPRLPDVVIAATVGIEPGDLAAGDTLAQANTYTDVAIAAAGGSGSGSIVGLSQAEYDALDPPDPDVLYLITDAGADAGDSVVALTQAEYDALDPPDPDILYVITDA